MVVPESSHDRSCSKESPKNVPSTITIPESGWGVLESPCPKDWQGGRSQAIGNGGLPARLRNQGNDNADSEIGLVVTDFLVVKPLDNQQKLLVKGYPCPPTLLMK